MNSLLFLYLYVLSCMTETSWLLCIIVFVSHKYIQEDLICPILFNFLNYIIAIHSNTAWPLCVLSNTFCLPLATFCNTFCSRTSGLGAMVSSWVEKTEKQLSNTVLMVIGSRIHLKKQKGPGKLQENHYRHYRNCNIHVHIIWPLLILDSVLYVFVNRV